MTDNKQIGKDAYIKSTVVEIDGYAGSNVVDSVAETFQWFYSGDGRDFDRAIIRNLNGIKVTFEREE